MHDLAKRVEFSMHGDGELEDLRSSIPSFDHFIEPLLFYLAKQREPVPAREAHERVADALGLTKAQKRVSLENGQPIYKNQLWLGPRPAEACRTVTFHSTWILGDHR